MNNAIRTSLQASIILTTLFSQTSSFADRKWNDANDPRNLDSTYKLNFYQLPPAGDVTNGNRGWSSSYFPKTKGYIAERWQDPKYAGVGGFKKYPMLTVYDVNGMSAEQIDLLSPAEKFDIARGNFEFPLTTQLRKDDPSSKDWWRGVCGGWTQAAVNIAEPHPIVYTNPKTKISISMNSGDIKGLMAYYYAYRDTSGASYIGKSCRLGKKLMLGLDGSCKDVNAAAFHVALTNEIGLKKNPLAVDRDPGMEVWNQPFVKYTSTVDRIVDRDISKKATDGTAKELYVTTVVTFANEQYKIDASEIKEGYSEEDYEDDVHAAPSAQPVLGTALQKYRSKTYKYVLELDARDQIIGGDWLSDSDAHPDLIWKQKFSMPGQGYDKDNKDDSWVILKDIIRMATAYAN